jgi:starvation-inducible outer membrane lipoprotein
MLTNSIKQASAQSGYEKYVRIGGKVSKIKNIKNKHHARIASQ